jgi:hypothetical protein
MGGALSMYGVEDRYIQDFGGESLGKETTYKTKRRWEYNIKKELQEVGWGYGTGLTWLRKGTGSFECGNEL